MLIAGLIKKSKILAAEKKVLVPPSSTGSQGLLKNRVKKRRKQP